MISGVAAARHDDIISRAEVFGDSDFYFSFCLHPAGCFAHGAFFFGHSSFAMACRAYGNPGKISETAPGRMFYLPGTAASPAVDH